MKFLRVTAIILAACILGIVIHSCCEGYAYKWAYIIAKNLDTRNKMENIYYENDSVSREDYGIRIHFFEQKLISQVPALFLNDLYATSCDESYPTEDTIVDITIITLKPFNANTAAGEDVSEYFLELFHQYPIEQEIERINQDKWSMVDYIDLEVIDSTLYESEHQFIVNVHLSDNRIMSDTTEPVILY
jgi:hypothetical protein